ncbi:MAG: hypothetical protein AB7E05_08875 [Sphingobium sp.]
MIDTFSIMLSHGLLLIAFWRLLARDDLDREEAPNAVAAAREQDEPSQPPRRETIFPHA